jgi:hypothetical protein
MGGGQNIPPFGRPKSLARLSVSLAQAQKSSALVPSYRPVIPLLGDGGGIRGQSQNIHLDSDGAREPDVEQDER